MLSVPNISECDLLFDLSRVSEVQDLLLKMTTYFNASDVEDDVYDDIKSDDYSNEISDLYIFMIFSMIFTLVVIIVALVVVSANIFLICVICRFKRLRIRANMYILNCCVLNVVHMISLLIFAVLSHYTEYFTYCFKANVLNAFLNLYIVFAFALALDWFLSGYIPNMMQKYNKFYKYVFIGVYMAFFIEGSVATIVCYANRTETRFYILNVLYILSLVVLVLLNILAKKVTLKNSSFKTAYSLTIANIILFSFLPFLIINVLCHVFNAQRYLLILIYAACISLLPVLAHPILVVYMLGKRNKYFKMAYKRSFKKSVRDYADENLDEGSDDENDVENCGVKVNYLSECEGEPKLILKV